MPLNIIIPKTDTECWDRYPKFRWVYETTKLLNSQNLKWSFVKDDHFKAVCPMSSFNLSFSSVYLKYSSVAKVGEIYTEDADNYNSLYTDVVIQKGNIKWLKHHMHGIFKEDINADIELRISALIIMYFTKWSGVLSIKTIGKDIYAIKLMPSNMLDDYPSNIKKIVNTIYKVKDKPKS